ncbi:MAG: hypothetical protein WB496_26815, partial [Pseudolabrys sp.]
NHAVQRGRVDRAATRVTHARTGTEQLSKRYFQDRVPPQTKYAVVRAGLITIAWPFLLALTVRGL